MFKIRKEIGVSEVISLGAFIVSCLAFWYSTKSDDGFIVQGGGAVQVAVLKDTAGCVYSLAIPVEFHNSGKQAVALKQLAPADSVNTVLFSGDQKMILDREVFHEIYRSRSGIGAVPSLWLKKIRAQQKFEPSHKHIDDLILPGDSYKFNIILLIDPYKQLSDYSTSSVYVAFNAIFNNGQTLLVRNSVEIDNSEQAKCS